MSLCTTTYAATAADRANVDTTVPASYLAHGIVGDGRSGGFDSWSGTNIQTNKY